MALTILNKHVFHHINVGKFMSYYFFWYVYLVGLATSFLMILLGHYVGFLVLFLVLMLSFKLSVFSKWRKNIEQFKSVELRNIVFCLSPLIMLVLGNEYEELILWVGISFFVVNNFYVDKIIKRECKNQWGQRG